MDHARPTSPNAESPPLLQHFGRNAPSVEVRLLLWFGIYLAAEVPMVWRDIFFGESYNFAIAPFLMPSVLGMIVAIPFNLLPSSVSEPIAGPVIAFGLVSGYLVYLLNFVLLLRVHTRRRFSALLLIHVTTVLLNQGMFSLMAHSISM